MLFEPGVDLGAAKAKHVRAEPESGELAGAPAAENARRRKAEELGYFAGGEERIAHFGVKRHISIHRR
jgi:hypothetical protein